MTEKNNFKSFIPYALAIAIFAFAFFIIRPIFLAIIYGLLLAYFLFPIQKLLVKKIKNETISAFIVSIGFFIVVIIVLAIIFGALFKQGLDFYLSIKNINIDDQISKIIPPSLIPSEIITPFIENIKTAMSNAVFNFLDQFNNFIKDLPVLILKFAVTIFVFFFALRDGDKVIQYLKSVSPIRKETEDKFIKKFKDVTNSVLLGQVFIGIIQGAVAGISFFIFGVPNAILLTLVAMIASIIPLVGPWVIWFPIFLFLLFSGRTDIVLYFLLYNLIFTSLIDNILRPLFISKRTQINSAIVLVGMIGGLFVLGIAGLIIGPLVLAYVILVIEIYKKKNDDEIILSKKEEKRF